MARHGFLSLARLMATRTCEQTACDNSSELIRSGWRPIHRFSSSSSFARVITPSRQGRLTGYEWISGAGCSPTTLGGSGPPRSGEVPDARRVGPPGRVMPFPVDEIGGRV